MVLLPGRAIDACFVQWESSGADQVDGVDFKRRQSHLRMINMKLMKKVAVQATVILLASMGASETFAQTTIKKLGAGWANDEFTIVPEGTVNNPARCSMGDAYDMNSTNGGYKTLLATALTASASGQRVEVIVHDKLCSSTNRPLILGINVIN